MTAYIVPFPQARNIGKARHVAARWLAKTTKNARDAYWTQVLQGLAQTLHNAGFDSAAIDEQAQQLARAVEREIERIYAERRAEGLARQAAGVGQQQRDLFEPGGAA